MVLVVAALSAAAPLAQTESPSGTAPVGPRAN